MTCKTKISKDYIFKEDESNQLIFVGDFDGYYSNCSDPWEQSGAGDTSGYYQKSRSRIARCLNESSVSTVLEIGCGLGYATDFLASASKNISFTGLDISQGAIDRATQLFPCHKFVCGDISDARIVPTLERYDAVILNQLLWYILDDLESVVNNASLLLAPSGKLIISNAFAREQRYGKHIINGYSGAFDYFAAFSDSLQMTHSEYNDEQQERLIDGLFILTERSSS